MFVKVNKNVKVNKRYSKDTTTLRPRPLEKKEEKRFTVSIYA